MKVKETIKDLLRPLYRQFLAVKNKGNNVTCNICGKHFSRLRPVMGRHADGTLFEIEDHVGRCWFCDSYPRNRQLFYWLLNDYKIMQADSLRILHIAPEVQISDRLLKHKGIDYICVDKRCEGYKYPDYVLNGDVCNLEFDDNTFDMVICNHVLEHVKDDRCAMNEIKRVLKRNGVAILMSPIDVELDKTIEEKKDENLTADEREERFGQFDHVRLYGIDYFDRLKEAGFSVYRISYKDEMTAKFGFMPGEDVIVCKKD
ncbi:MAG: methyltransferase domain-containing protein [Bacteroidales bacterium]|nr:methyltransferase domain-containing protein [Bacteroidales bacterium]